MRFARAVELAAFAAALVLLSPRPAAAFRPFEGDDAAVERARRLNVEVGPVGYQREGDDRFLACPELGLSLGIGHGFEVGGEATRLLVMSPDPEGARPDWEDVELTAKKVLRSGSLQDGHHGLSVATEGAVLLPTTTIGHAGTSLALIASQEWRKATFHLSGQVRHTREGDAGKFASLIVEGPGVMQVHPVTELVWEREGSEEIARSILAGLVWETRAGLSIDFAVRTGKGAESFTEVRSGLTFNRHVPAPKL